MKYRIGQKLPVVMDGFMGAEIPCDAKITAIQYVLRADFNDGQFSEMILSEKELEDRIIGNPEPIYRGNELTYYQPSCPHGHTDCINDPIYIKEYYPDWYKELGSPTSCSKDCEDGEWYDDEDK